MSSSPEVGDRSTDLTEPSSLLYPIPFTDISSLRRIQARLYDLLHPTTLLLTPSVDVSEVEDAVLARITHPLFPTQFNPLFTTLCTKFASAYASSEAMVLTAAKHFDLLATVDVWGLTAEGRSAYSRIKGVVHELITCGEMNYEDDVEDQIFIDTDNVESFSANHGSENLTWVSFQSADLGDGVNFYEQWNDNHYDENEMNSPYRHDLRSESGNFALYYPLNVVAPVDGTQLTEQELFEVETPVKDNHSYGNGPLDPQSPHNFESSSQTAEGYNNDYSIEDDDDDDDIPVSEEYKAAQEKRAQFRKHRTIRNRGEKFVVAKLNDHDRLPAICNGIPQPSKLRETFRTEKPDPNDPDRMIPGEPAEYVYHNAVDWNDRQSVQRLNNWRSQMFRRALGPQRETRTKWTMKEHDYFLHILKKHVDSPAVNGRYSNINWDYIATKFNKKWEGHTFKAGEILATAGQKTKRNRHLKFDVSRKDTTCTARSYMSMQNQLAHFTSAKAKAILKATKEADEADRLRGPLQKAEIRGKKADTINADTNDVDNIDPRLRSGVSGEADDELTDEVEMSDHLSSRIKARKAQMAEKRIKNAADSRSTTRTSVKDTAIQRNKQAAKSVDATGSKKRKMENTASEQPNKRTKTLAEKPSSTSIDLLTSEIEQSTGTGMSIARMVAGRPQQSTARLGDATQGPIKPLPAPLKRKSPPSATSSSAAVNTTGLDEHTREVQGSKPRPQFIRPGIIDEDDDDNQSPHMEGVSTIQENSSYNNTLQRHAFLKSRQGQRDATATNRKVMTPPPRLLSAFGGVRDDSD